MEFVEPLALRPASEADAPALVRIYNHYVERTIVSFELEPVELDEFRRRMAAVREAGLPWWVAEEVGEAMLEAPEPILFHPLADHPAQ